MRSKAISRYALRWRRPRPTDLPIPQRCFRRSAGAGGIAPIWPRTKMRSDRGNEMRESVHRGRLRFWSPASAALAAILIVSAGCSPDTASEAQTPAAPAAANATLTPEQRQHISLFTVASSDYRKSVETTGVVDFD